MEDITACLNPEGEGMEVSEEPSVEAGTVICKRKHCQFETTSDDPATALEKYMIRQRLIALLAYNPCRNKDGEEVLPKCYWEVVRSAADDVRAILTEKELERNGLQCYFNAYGHTFRKADNLETVIKLLDAVGDLPHSLDVNVTPACDPRSSGDVVDAIDSIVRRLSKIFEHSNIVHLNYVPEVFKELVRTPVETEQLRISTLCIRYNLLLTDDDSNLILSVKTRFPTIKSIEINQKVRVKNEKRQPGDPEFDEKFDEKSREEFGPSGTSLGGRRHATLLWRFKDVAWGKEGIAKRKREKEKEAKEEQRRKANCDKQAAREERHRCVGKDNSDSLEDIQEKMDGIKAEIREAVGQYIGCENCDNSESGETVEPTVDDGSNAESQCDPDAGYSILSMSSSSSSSDSDHGYWDDDTSSDEDDEDCGDA